MNGFWPKSTTTKMKKPVSGLAKCGVCGLLDTCKSPQMPVYGDGARGVLIVGEAPGKVEDDEGRPFVGPAGDRLRTHLNNVGVRLDRDCWTTNANICRPPDNATPNDKQIAACRPYLLKAVKELNPTTIILLGGNAIRSFVGSVWAEKSMGVGTWAGWRVPLRSHNVWVCPTYHPSWVMREDRPIADMWFEEHLEAAFAAADGGRPYPETPPELEESVQVELDPSVAAKKIREFQRRGGWVAFDFETTMLKPDKAEAEIVSCAVCWQGRETVAYIWHGEAIKATSELLRDSSVPKLGWNAKFEDRWARAKLGHPVSGWAWDGMVNAHLLDNRPGITSVKFQSFVRLGIRLYNDNIEQYLRSDGTNIPNRVREIEINELLKYNGMDAILEYICCMQQMEEVGLVEEIQSSFNRRHAKRYGVFDERRSSDRKREGMQIAADSSEHLTAARKIAIELAEDRGTVTADDVGRVLHERYGIETLGPAAGSLFKGKQWEFTGERVKSARTTNNARELKVWRLANG